MQTPENTKPRRKRDVRCPVSRIEMTPLKERILAAVLVCRLATGDQLPPLGVTAKVRNEVLRALFDHGYLDRIFPTQSPFSSPVYHIGKKGVPIAVAALARRGIELSADELAATVRKPPLSQLDHALAIADVHSALVLRAREDAATGFLPEAAVRIEYEARSAKSQKWQARCFAPDGGLIAAAAEGEEAAVFLEIDMCTVSLARFSSKCETFSHVRSSGLAEKRLGMPADALAVVTISERRLESLRRVAEKSGGSGIILSTLSEIKERGVAAAWTESNTGRRGTLADHIERKGKQR